MNEFEEQVPMDYIDESVPAMVEQQGDFQDIEQSYQADGTVGADDQGNFMEDGDGGTIITADGQEYDPEGREGASISNIAGKARTAASKLAGEARTSVGNFVKDTRNVGKNRAASKLAGEAATGFADKGNAARVMAGKADKAKSGLFKGQSGIDHGVAGASADRLAASGRAASQSFAADANRGVRNRAIIGGAGAAAAAGLGAAAYANRKKDEDKRAGGRFGEGEFDETYEAPYTGEVEEQVVDYSDPVEANYASIQAAVNYAMQDNRL